MTLTTLALVNMETGQRGFLLSGKETSLEPYINGKKDLIKNLNMIKQIIKGTSVTRSDVQSVEDAVNQWQIKVADVEITARKAMNQYKVTIDDLIADMSKGIGKKYMDTIRAKIREIVEDEEKMIVTRGQSQSDTADFATTFALFGTIFSTILGLVIAIIITKNITSKINSFQIGLLGFFKYLNREQDDVKLLEDKTTDEIGNMAKVVNENISKTKKGIDEDRRVIDNTINVLNEFEQGDLNQRVKTSSSNPALRELTKLLNKMGENIESNLNGILTILEEYSNAKYTHQAKTEGIKAHLFETSKWC